jgi:hypothetical protein
MAHATSLNIASLASDSHAVISSSYITLATTAENKQTFAITYLL